MPSGCFLDSGCSIGGEHEKRGGMRLLENQALYLGHVKCFLAFEKQCMSEV